MIRDWGGKGNDVWGERGENHKGMRGVCGQVSVKRQKLLGLKSKGKLACDDTPMAEVKLKPGQKVMMMG